MAEDSGNSKIREATVAGLFYPEARMDLERELATLLDEASRALDEPTRPGGPIRAKLGGRVSAIISPHAGFGYSGDLCALAWASAAGRDLRRVIVLAPQHRAEEPLVYLPESELFDCPLGPVRVDREFVESLRDCGTVFAVNDIPHFEEHGVEVQLPFMRALFPGAALVPVILGTQGPAIVRALASGLDLALGDERESCLIVMSTDLASGLDRDGPACRSDEFLARVAGREWRSLLGASDPDAPSACGAGCVAAYLASSLSEGAEALVLGRHDSSAFREYGDERIVEYAAVAFARTEGAA